jgi:hypothetical protein
MDDRFVDDHLQSTHSPSAMQLAIDCRSNDELTEHDQAAASERRGRLRVEEYLGAENMRLTRLLNEQRRALTDEEIVRSIATRSLFSI